MTLEEAAAAVAVCALAEIEARRSYDEGAIDYEDFLAAKRATNRARAFYDAAYVRAFADALRGQSQ